MIPSRFLRAALAAALGLGVWAGLARAQDSVIIAPLPVFPPPPTGPWIGEEAPPVEVMKRPKPVHDVLHLRHPQGCWTTFNSYSCGSLKSECQFLFGSCRTFFGEPCLRGTPPPLLPPGVALPPSGCGCR